MGVPRVARGRPQSTGAGSPPGRSSHPGGDLYGAGRTRTIEELLVAREACLTLQGYRQGSDVADESRVEIDGVREDARQGDHALPVGRELSIRQRPCPEPVVTLVGDLQRGHEEHLRHSPGKRDDEEHVLQARARGRKPNATPEPPDGRGRVGCAGSGVSRIAGAGGRHGSFAAQSQAGQRPQRRETQSSFPGMPSTPRRSTRPSMPSTIEEARREDEQGADPSRPRPSTPIRPGPSCREQRQGAEDTRPPARHRSRAVGQGRRRGRAGRPIGPRGSA